MDTVIFHQTVKGVYKMGKINALDTDTSILNNLPLGYYYYYIPYNMENF